MALDHEEQTALRRTLARLLPGFRKLAATDRLTAGASLETYRLMVETDDGSVRLAMRRTPGGEDKLSAPWTPSIEAEAKLFAIARDHDVPEPRIHHVLEPKDGLGRGFIMEWLDGETLGQRIVKSEDLAEVRTGLARQCGEILGRIHSIDLETTGLSKLLHQWSTVDLVRSTIAKYESYGVSRPMLDFTGRWLLENLPPDDRQALVHNDFRNGNLIIGKSGVVAVLDWEHSYVGDPVRDLGWLCNNSWRYGRPRQPVGGFGHVDDLLAGYEQETGLRVEPDHLRFWEIFGSLYWAVGCMELAQQHRLGQARGVERLVIGRRISECEVDCANLLLPENADCPSETISAPTEFADNRELLEGVSEFLRDEVAKGSDKRLSYLARVAANALSIVDRELILGPLSALDEHAELADLMGIQAELPQLREELARRLRSGEISLDQPGLADHLRKAVEAQIAIDQPRYWGRRTTLSDQTKPR